jgi:hypothetical protein
MNKFETKYDLYYKNCISLFAQTGSVEDLFRTADAITGNDGDYRDVTLGKLARFFAERQQVAEASRFCSAIGDPLERADSMLGVAGILHKQGESDSVKRFLSDAAKTAEAAPHAYETAAVFLHVADLLEKSGELAQASDILGRAIELVRPASQAFEPAKTLRGCARLLASWNRVPDAIAVAEAIEIPELRTTTLEEIQGRGKWPITPGVRI